MGEAEEQADAYGPVHQMHDEQRDSHRPGCNRVGDGRDERERITPLLAVARQFGLSAHDASYLELAMTTGFPLATGDARLKNAATSAGVFGIS